VSGQTSGKIIARKGPKRANDSGKRSRRKTITPRGEGYRVRKNKNQKNI